MHIVSIGVDLGKNTFHLVALGERSKTLLRKKFSRAQLPAYTANLPSSLIGLEACAGSHGLGSVLHQQGHQVRLMPAQFVKPYRKSNKNDFLDAEAIAEAVTKQNMRFAQLKTQEQLDVQAMHRVRDRLVQRRTALINEIRGFLLERGITFAAGPIHLRKNLLTVIEDAEQNLSSRLRWLLERLWLEWKQLESDIKTITEEIERIANQHALCRRLQQIPGFGPWSLPRLWPPSVTALPFGEGATLPPGLAWCHGNTPPGKTETARHRQARQHLFASHVDPRCSCSAVSRQVRHRRIRAMGSPADAACTAQQSRGRNRQQTGSHGLGGTVQWQRLSAPGFADERSLIGRGKDAGLGKHKPLSTFPPPLRLARRVPFKLC